MAFVWKHPASQFWFARFADERGTKVNRSTKCADRREAQKVADGWEHAARLARSGMLTSDKARSVLSEMLERLSGGAESIRSEGVEEFLLRWQALKTAQKSSATAERYRSVTNKFLDSLGDRRNRPLCAIRPADVEKFLTARAEKRASKTVSIDAKCLSAAFGYAVRQGLIDRNPVTAVELPDVRSQEREPFTVGQVKLLVNAAEGEWRTAILCGYYSGARLSDVVKLQWDALDLVKGVWTYVQGKTGEAVKVPLHPELQRHLEGIAGDSAGGPVMPTLAGRGTGGASGLSSQFNDIMKAAGIAQTRTETKSGRTFASLSFHSLRHSFESHLAAADVSPELRRELTGRANESVQKVYTHLETEQMRKAIGQLPNLVQG